MLNREEELRFCKARRAAIALDYQNLNPEQRRAALATDGPLLLLAGAGSGKTTVLIHRIANLMKYGRGSDCDEAPAWAAPADLAFLEGYVQNPDPAQKAEQERLCRVDPAVPWSIIAITFTNKAAGELKERLERMLGPSANDIWASTFHSACVRILRRDIDRLGFTSSFTIYDTADSERVIKDIVKDFNLDEKAFAPRSILGYISRAKDAMKLGKDYLQECEKAGDYRLVKIAKVYAEYERRLREANALDFDDIILDTVRLLQNFDDVREYYQKKFRYVLIDEYQDTNEVQNAIFTALSREGRNLFLVGDVKQSIYRFRLADPTIFLGKYRAFADYTRAAEGEERRLILSRNFRSRPEVLEGANFVFRSVMSADFGEMDYTADEALYPGAPFPPDGRYAVELDAVDASAEGEEEKTARDLIEARFAAKRIRTLVDGGFPISDGEGGERPVRPADIVILLRSPNTVLHHYARALGERDIPWEAEGGGDFFAATEVNVALSLLQIVDNPRQDVPLISVLRSPVYGFSADRLAELRAADFYAALAADGGEDSRAFLAELDELRFGAGELSSHELLWQLYDRTNLLGVFGAMDRGEERQSNLLTLAELARRFEGAGHKGLFGFLSYLTRLRENGAKLALPAPGREGGGVRILSIHKSKGLEFPVVLLCGLARRLNREDMSRPILFHPKLGVGPKRLDVERGMEYPTLARRAVARKLELEMMAEELRLLYVAMTRAKEKLILSVALTGGARDLEKLAPDAACPVEPQVLAGCQSVGQWVLLPALARPDGEVLRRAAGVQVPVPAADFGPAWDIRFVDGAEFQAEPEENAISPSGPPDGEMISAGAGEETAALAARLAWHYPHGAEVELPSKLTATQLKGRALDEEVAEAAVRPPRPIRLGRPRFATEEFGLTPAQKGTALHLVMQYIDFERTERVEQVRAEIARLVERAFLTPQQGEAVDPAKIAAFFASPLGRELMASTSLRREFKFSILVPAADYYPQAGAEEQVLLQGVVDCCFETLEGITVVDFKTDRVDRRSVAARAEEYRPQLAAYSRALEEITGKPVIRRCLWFFALDQAVDV